MKELFNSKKNFGVYTKKRLILNVKDSTKLFFKHNYENENAWRKDNFYTYDIVVPPSSTNNIYESIVHDLNNYSGYYGRVERRKMACYILVETKKANIKQLNNQKSPRSSIANGIHYLQDAPAYLIVDILNKNTALKLSVVNKVKTAIRADLKLELNKLSVEEIKKQLIPFGLDLIEGQEELEVLVISDKTQLKIKENNGPSAKN